MDDFAPPHLSEVIQDELDCRNWSLADLALKIGPTDDYGLNKLTLDLFWCVRRPECYLGDETLAKIATVFDVSPKFLSNIHGCWADWMTTNRLEQQIAPSRFVSEAEMNELKAAPHKRLNHE